MASVIAVPLVRCRLADGDGGRRYVPVTEFGLWRHLMESRHGRRVEVEAVSVWIDAESAAGDSRAQGSEAVLRLRIELPGPFGVAIPIERYAAAEDVEALREVLHSHYGLRMRPGCESLTSGFFVTTPGSQAPQPPLGDVA